MDGIYGVFILLLQEMRSGIMVLAFQDFSLERDQIVRVGITKESLFFGSSTLTWTINITIWLLLIKKWISKLLVKRDDAGLSSTRAKLKPIKLSSNYIRQLDQVFDAGSSSNRRRFELKYLKNVHEIYNQLKRLKRTSFRSVFYMINLNKRYTSRLDNK